MKTNIIILLSFMLMAGSLLAQPEVVETANTPPVAETTEGVNLPPVSTDLVPTKSSQEVWLSLGVLFFGMVVVLAQAFIINRRQEPLSQSLKYLSVSLIDQSCLHRPFWCPQATLDLLCGI